MKKLISIILALSIAFSLVGCDSSDYKKGLELYEQGEYSNAQLIFEGLGDYKDSMQMVKACYYYQQVIKAVVILVAVLSDRKR